MSELTQEKLYEKYNRIQEYDMKLFETVYKSCIRTIELESKHGNLYCRFDIPNYSFSDPIGNINIPLCATYIQNKLPKYIQSSFINPNVLVLSWFKKL